MGQFLAIGIVTNLKISKKEMLEKKITNSQVLEQIENKLHFPINIYDIIDDDSIFSLILKNDVFINELIPFLEKFYELIYKDEENGEYADEVIHKLKTSNSSEWMGIAENKSLYFFQEDKYSARDTLHFDIHFNPHISVHYNCIMLSAEGKILMEEYGRQFNFIKYCMKKAFNEFKIAGALRIYITG